jgi:hypothetical protein
VDKDAFCITSQKIDYFRRLLNMKGKHSLCLALRRFLLPLRRR